MTDCEIFMNAPEGACEQELGAYLDDACGGDDALRAKVDALLAVATEAEQGMMSDAALDDLQERREELIRRTQAQGTSAEGKGSLVGNYKLLQQIGEGGFGVVYMAEQLKPVKRRVALKIIKPGMDSRQVVARFEAERQALALMDHPNIAKVHDAGETEAGRPYFVMELVRGIPITEFCDDRNLSTGERLELFIDVCHAVQHAHQKGVIHRDLKPSNVMVTLHDDGAIVKVIDFGVAKATQSELTDKTLFTMFEQFIGTPAYMSPEQAQMSSLDIDTRSDIYSLGVLLYELLTGRTPFDQKDLLKAGYDEMRRVIREDEPPKPSTRMSTLADGELTDLAKHRKSEPQKLKGLLRGDLDWIVMKALEKDRARRYDTANGLAMDVRRHLADEPVVAAKPSASYRITKYVRRHRGAVAAGGAVAIALLLGVVASTMSLVGERAARAEADLSSKRAMENERVAVEQSAAAEKNAQRARRLLYASDINLAQQALLANNVGKARVLLDRHRPVPGEEIEDLRGWEWRYLWKQTLSDALRTITIGSAEGSAVSFSPDGRFVAFGFSSGIVELWDVVGETSKRRLSEMQQSKKGKGRVVFSPNREQLWCTDAGGSVVSHDLGSGEAHTVWQLPGLERDVRQIVFSADGARAAIYVGRNGPAPDPERTDLVVVIDVATGAVTHEFFLPHSGTSYQGRAGLSPAGTRLYAGWSNRSANEYSIRCFDLETDGGAELWRTQTESDAGVSTLGVSPDGKWVASGSGFEDRRIRIWDAENGSLVGSPLEGHLGWVAQLVFTPDGRHLFSAGSDQTIRIWDTSTWKEVGFLQGHSDEVHALAISTDGDLLASAGKEGAIMLWDSRQQDLDIGQRVYSQLPETVRDTQMLNKSLAWITHSDRAAELVDLATDKVVATLAARGLPPHVLRIVDRRWFVLWDSDLRQIQVHELRDEEWHPAGAVPVTPAERPTPIAFDVLRKRVAWPVDAQGDTAGSVRVVSLDSAKRSTDLFYPDSGQRTLVHIDFSVDGRFLLAWISTARSYHDICVWDLESCEITARLSAVAKASFTLEGSGLVATVNHDKKETHDVVFIDLESPGSEPTRASGRQLSNDLAVSADGKMVATTNRSGLVTLYDAEKGELARHCLSHMNSAFTLSFSDDGRRLISGSGAREAVKLWDVATGQELLNLSGNGSILLHSGWGGDGTRFVVGDESRGSWQVWSAPSWEEIEKAEAGDADRRTP